ncbi:hypothetical protein H8V64_001943 [Enterococcus faecalis]|nr:hypothetical protein [Enterococcus faecalis]
MKYSVWKVEFSTINFKFNIRYIIVRQYITKEQIICVLIKTIPLCNLFLLKKELLGEVICLVDDSKEYKNIYGGLVDEYWIDGTIYIQEIKDKEEICVYIVELFDKINKEFKYISEEYCNCWIMRMQDDD